MLGIYIPLNREFRERKEVALMKGAIMGRGIVGMPAAKDIQIGEMAIVMVVNGQAVAEKISGIAGNLPCNSAKINLTTTSGRRVVLQPETKNEVEDVCAYFSAPDEKKQMLLASY